MLYSLMGGMIVTSGLWRILRLVTTGSMI
jgi:hypothetical protein